MLHPGGKAYILKANYVEWCLFFILIKISHGEMVTKYQKGRTTKLRHIIFVSAQ